MDNSAVIAKDYNALPASTLAQALTATQQSILNPITGYALIDTGASRTGVDIGILKKLNINPTGITMIGTASGPARQSLFPARLQFPKGELDVHFESVIGVNLQGQEVGGQQMIALVGRDILMNSVFIYNGLQGSFSLAHSGK